MADTAPTSELDHDVPQGGPSVVAPAGAVEDGGRWTPAEEARTLVSATNAGTLATLAEDGGPWASLVAYGALDDGSPVLLVSRLAEHARNLLRDPRASLVVSAPRIGEDALAAGRVTLAGTAVRPEGDLELLARDRYIAAVPGASTYAAFGDFSLWVLRVERARWVGGYGRMGSATGEDYAAAEPDPIGVLAGDAVAHLNADHADALLAMARVLAGHPDATSARCHAVDGRGLDLFITTPSGFALARLGFAETARDASALRAATVELARRAR